MPRFRMFVLEDPEGAEGLFEEWELPWERLVFDQRLNHAKEGKEETRYRILGVREDGLGTYYLVAPDRGGLEGCDPKKDRP